MSRNVQRIVLVLLGLIPFLGIAAMVYYNVEREIPLYPPVTMQSGRVVTGDFVATHTLSSAQRAAAVEWLERERYGWKKEWSTPAPGYVTLVSAHRQVQDSTLSLMPGFAIYTCEEGVFFKKIDAAKTATLESLLLPKKSTEKVAA
jgi:hypothetical protein